MSPKYQYDVFISHAVEDKLVIANELADRLQKASLKVWYSGRELNAGDSITDTIHQGLNKSRFGIVILSKNYLNKRWTLREFYTLLAREDQDNKVIIPVLTDITPEELAINDLTMADRFALRSDKGLDYVVEKIVATIGKTKQTEKKSSLLWSALVITIAILTILGISFFWKQPDTQLRQAIETTIQLRSQQLQFQITKHRQDLESRGAKPATSAAIDSTWTAFKNIKSQYRNTYEFYNGRWTRSRKQVQAILNVDLEAWTPANNYLLNSPIRLLATSPHQSSYSYLNTLTLQPEILSTKLVSDTLAIAQIRFVNNIRYLHIDLTIEPNSPKRHRMIIFGFQPQERLTFRRDNGTWTLISFE